MLRVPTKRKINEVEKKAMVQMILNFKNYDLAQGARNTTICAFVFMQIMKRSKTYYENFNINNYLKAENENED